MVNGILNEEEKVGVCMTKQIQNPDIKNYFPYCYYLKTTRRIYQGQTAVDHFDDVLTERLTNDVNERLADTEFAQNGGSIHRAYVWVYGGDTNVRIHLEATQPLTSEAKCVMNDWIVDQQKSGIVVDTLKDWTSNHKPFNDAIEFVVNEHPECEWCSFDGDEDVTMYESHYMAKWEAEHSTMLTDDDLVDLSERTEEMQY